LPRQDSSKDSSWSSRMPVETDETPGVYHALNHWNPGSGARGRIWILPP
jgi:hypothetical protein